MENTLSEMIVEIIFVPTKISIDVYDLYVIIFDFGHRPFYQRGFTPPTGSHQNRVDAMREIGG